MLVVLLIVAVAILCGVVVVAMGRGGELARPTADVRPLDGEIMTAADVALLRPPAALWGYDMRSTDEALNMVARTVTDRDVEIAILRRQIADLEAVGHLTSPNLFLVDPIYTKAMHVYKNGKRLSISYWCATCSIRTYTPGNCVCCQQWTDLDLEDDVK